MYKSLTATTLLVSMTFASLPLGAQQEAPQVPMGAKALPADSTGVTSWVVGDTLLVECHPETVVPKRRPVAAKPRSGVKKGTRAVHRVRKSPGAKSIQVCKETRLPEKPSVKPVMGPVAEAMGPIEGPLETGEAAGILPQGAMSGPVVGNGRVLRGGAIAGVPIIFLAFLHHGNDHPGDNGNTPGIPGSPVNPPHNPPPIDSTPTPPTTTPEPSTFMLLGTGLAGLGSMIRRRKK